MKSVSSLPFISCFVYFFLLFSAQSFGQTGCSINSVNFTIAQINGIDGNPGEKETDIDQTLDGFEDQLFFKQYRLDDQNTRLSRIEKQIFGESYNDGADKRVARIKDALPPLPQKASPETSSDSEQQNLPIHNNKLNSPPKEPAADNSQLPSDNAQTDQGDAAERERLKVMAARAYEINTLLAKAVALYRQKHLKESIAIFNQVIRLDSQNAAAHFSLGIALEASGDLAAARDHYQQALDIEPDNKDYQLAMQGLRNKSNQQNATKLNDYKVQLLTSQAGEAFKQGQYEQSLALNKKLDALTPNQALIKYNIGTIYLMLNKPKDALPYYKEAHKLEPANAQYSDYLQKLQSTIKNGNQNEKTGKTNSVPQQSAGNKSGEKWLLANFGFKVKSSKQGIKIKEISSGSRAAQVGLLTGDIIQVIDGLTINQVQQVEAMLGSKPLGQRFQFIVLRNGQVGQLLF